MTNKPLRAFATIIAVIGAYITSAAQIPEGYYDSLKGKKGAELKNAVYNIIKDANVLSYGSGYGKTWWDSGKPTVQKTDVSLTATLQRASGHKAQTKVP